MSLTIGQKIQVVPVNLIIMWSGTEANIPAGWQLCNGVNGSPDLRDRFVVGAGYLYNVGNTFGAASVTLTSDNMPSHTHSNSGTGADSAHTHTIGGNTGDGGAHKHTVTMSDSGVHTHTLIESTDHDTRNDGYPAHTFLSGMTSANTADFTGKHKHTFSDTNTASTHTHTTPDTNTHSAHTHTTSDTNNAGTGSAHNNLPKYYALCFIMKEDI